MSVQALFIKRVEEKRLNERLFYATSLLNSMPISTRARMLNSIYHFMLKSFCFHFFGMRTSMICHLLCNVTMDVIMLWF